MVGTGTGTMPTEYFCTNTGKQITVSDCLRQIAALEKQIVGRDNEIIVIRDTARIAIAALERELAEAKGLYHEALVDGDATRFKMRMLESELTAAQDELEQVVTSALHYTNFPDVTYNAAGTAVSTEPKPYEIVDFMGSQLKAAQDHAASIEASCRELDSKLLSADLENKRLEAQVKWMVEKEKNRGIGFAPLIGGEG